VTEAGRPVDPDDQLSAMRNELYPVPSLARISTNAKFTVSTVSIVGTALTAFGLVTAASLSVYGPVQLLASAAAGIALLALLCALSYLALRLEKRNYQNNENVRNWYKKQFRRAGLVVAASWLLILAVLLAAAAGTVAAVNASKADAPVLGLVVAGTGDQRTVTATVSIDHLQPGDIVTLRVTSGTGQVVIVGETTADSSGSAKLDTTLRDAPGDAGYNLEVLVGGSKRGMLQVP
jgi:hypothetical protein